MNFLKKYMYSRLGILAIPSRVIEGMLESPTFLGYSFIEICRKIIDYFNLTDFEVVNNVVIFN